MSNLAIPNFIDRDVNTITQEMVAWYEAKTNKTLYPAQIERLFIDMMAYREQVVRISIQEASLQNLVRFAVGAILDYLAELVGVTRLPAQSATCTLKFSLTASRGSDFLIPAGTRVGTSTIEFATTADAVIVAGQTDISVSAICTQAGEIGNGWIAGQLNTLIDDLFEPDLTAVNVDVSANGINQESDDNLKIRIIDAPEGYTTAGSRGAYTFHTRSVSQNIIDVAIMSPGYGEVRIYPLTKTGLPSPSLCDLVAAACNAERVRPLTDTVVVLPPTIRNYAIRARVTPLKNVDADALVDTLTTLAEAYRDQRAATLGLDIVRLQCAQALKAIGIYDLALDEPSESMILAANEWAVCTDILITAEPPHEQ